MNTLNIQNLNFDRFNCKKLNLHPKYAHVDLYYLKNKNKEKHILSVRFEKDFTPTGKNIIIASSNSLITKEVLKTYDTFSEVQWMTVAKHISDTLSMDLVILTNTYCDTRNKHQYFDVHYYTSTPKALNTFRSDIQLTELREQEEDMSDEP